ncbi:hypothetical protein B0J12DRAFT_396438 [Macrophomina phaseolina]|uniref:Uncharacterized protein n=1 Tax=Macrophomina phaseolina TaxID=35725 RepID=A0ABQ8GIM2_9PEZI|nr:hypothetical protein B0J12DRAFT_396438 [Macrophomina phaseolina]
MEVQVWRGAMPCSGGDWGQAGPWMVGEEVTGVRERQRQRLEGGLLTAIGCRQQSPDSGPATPSRPHARCPPGPASMAALSPPPRPGRPQLMLPAPRTRAISPRRALVLRDGAGEIPARATKSHTRCAPGLSRRPDTVPPRQSPHITTSPMPSTHRPNPADASRRCPSFRRRRHRRRPLLPASALPPAAVLRCPPSAASPQLTPQSGRLVLQMRGLGAGLWERVPPSLCQLRGS